MKSILRSIKLQTKLITLFALLMVIFLFLGIREYVILNTLEKHQDKISANMQISQLALNIQSNLRYDIQSVFYQIEQTKDRKKIEQLWNEHLKKKSAIQKSISRISQIFTKSANQLYTSLNYSEKIKTNHHFISTIYIDSIQPKYERVYRSQKRLVAIQQTIDSLEFLSEQTLFDTIIEDTDEIVPIDTGFLPLPPNNFELDNFKSEKETIENKKNAITDSIKIFHRAVNQHLEQMNQTASQWITNSQKKSYSTIGKSLQITEIVIIVGIVLALLTFYFILRMLFRPLDKLQQIILQLAKGILPKKTTPRTTDEIGQILKALNKLIQGLKDTAGFSVEIGKGNFNEKFTPLSGEDVLGNSLISLSKSLQHAKEEESKRTQEDEIRNWAIQGETMVSDILRKTSDLRKLSIELIKGIVEYLDANQGGIFILNDEDKQNIILEQTAAYAYNRDKYVDQKIPLGIGLVGTVAIEKEGIYLTEIPDDYIIIESGLGNALPRNLAVIPLIYEAQVMGVLEVASFQPIEEHQVKFLEHIGENIGATFSNVRTTERTKKLLQKSQIQAEEMAAKEEAMKATIAEMQETKKKSEEREKQLNEKMIELHDTKDELVEKDKKQSERIAKLMHENSQKIKKLRLREKQSRTILENALDGVIVINEEGTIEFFNFAAQKIWGYSLAEIIGHNVSKLMPEDHAKTHTSRIKRFLKTGEKHVIGTGREVPILRKDGTETKIYLSVVDYEIDGKHKFTGFAKDLSKDFIHQKEYEKLQEKLRMIESEYMTKIAKLKTLLKKHDIPDI